MNMDTFNATTDGEHSLGIGNSRNEGGTRVDSKHDAQRSIATIERAMQSVASYRGTLGALQNRLESTDRNLAIQVESLSAARSRIKDADFAAESAEMTQASILQQAGASVLTQANNYPQIALKLLQG